MMTTPAWHVYLLECCDGTLYTGISTDLKRRLKMHNSGAGATYTRARRPVRMVYVEPHPDRSSALKREAALKRLRREEKKILIASGQGEKSKVTAPDFTDHG